MLLLRRWPDPVLADPVALYPPPVAGAALAVLCREMLAVMRAHGGIGLAANQVGVDAAVLLAELPGYTSPLGRGFTGVLVLVNPELVAARGAQPGVEGCLSVPGRELPVTRPARVTVRGLDAAGAPCTLELAGLAARIVCHELDHLAGTTILAPQHTAG